MKRTTRAALPVGIAAALLTPLLAPQFATQAHGATETAPATRVVSEGEVGAAAYNRDTTINRAKRWLTANDGRQVPYSQTKTWGGYRTDCSGYVSMALSLPKPGPNTVGLASSTYTRKIKMSSLRKGDLVIDANGTNTTRHVVIFVRWTSSAHKAYYAYEQRGSYGTDHSIRSYGIGADEYDAYRPKKYG
ncbi:NlpC/P60 family protein [Streptomyces cavernicola]|uniref:NlpC/P60 family protein n=1 Tax=Streptomyces cavernicola TaxID=3043613 RepID=A0ABT6SAC9_9ACTN|nr:NlpC/P60 family protein [Streptomyces sp. B-S-A6]MDI3405153.1 NlpC/P60 family protein [Streptomyces sp. B-S-A6]